MTTHTPAFSNAARMSTPRIASVQFFALATLLAASASPAAENPAAANHAIRFDRDVKPILAHHCFKCHGRGKEKGGLSLDSSEQLLRGGDSGVVVEQGNAARSRLIALVSGTDPELVMPPKEDGNAPLAAEQIATLRAWIDQGLDWTDERMTKPYALALRAVTVPAGEGSPIDRLLAPYFAGHGIVPESVVDDRRFARRVHLDLVGLLPSAEELEAFSRGASPGKRERLVRQLLAEREAFAGHWMSFWMDHLRIGSSLAASIFDHDNSNKPRVWLEGQLRAGEPYDRFVRELIAGPIFDDYLQSIAPPTEVANAQGRPEMQAAHVISQTFLGVRLQCASCHDSFVDRWTLRQAWSFASALGGESIEMARCEVPTGERAPPSFLFPELGGIDASLSAAGRRARMAELLTAPANGLFARTLVNRVWARLFGRGLVEPLDEMADHDAWHPELLDWLAGEFVRGRHDLGHLLALITTSRAYQLPTQGRSSQAEKAGQHQRQTPAPHASHDRTTDPVYLFRGPSLRPLGAETFVDTLATLAAPGKTDRAWNRKNDSLMKSLGRPDRNTVVTARTAEFSVLQTLEWMNGERLEALLQPAARSLIARRFSSPDALTRDVFLQLLGRPPTPAENERLARTLGAEPSEAAVADLLWAVVMLPEFRFIL